MNKKCQVFTPKYIVKEILKYSGYNKKLYGRKVIDNSCGDGNILTLVVERYINDCKKCKMSLEEIKSGLENDVYGFEIDLEHYNNCLRNLNKITDKFEIYNVDWKIFNEDFLKAHIDAKFDFVIGNPPYITYSELDKEIRKELRQNFYSCSKGKFDYYYAFIEKSIGILNSNGVLGYIIPNNVFKTVFGNRLREILIKNISEIYDYTSLKIFNGVLTSSAIIIVDKGNETKNIKYFDMKNNKKKIKISKSSLSEKWIFKNNTYDKNTIRFGDYFTARNTIATLSNSIFIMSDIKEFDKNNIMYRNYLIEKKLLREAVSPRSIKEKKSCKIIFPYYFEEGYLNTYGKKFEENFPNAYKYMIDRREVLLERKSDESVEWFEYGRTQAIAHMNQEKLLISTVITKKPKVYILNKDTIPFSGIFITSNGKIPLKYAKELLESKEFIDYVQAIGINVSGVSLRITSKDINNFKICKERVRWNR